MTKKKKIIDEVSEFMRMLHYSIHTERLYCDWIRKFILFHQMTSKDDLFVEPEKKIEKFLSHLANDKNVAKSTQNQAMNALVFLYRKFFRMPLDGKIDAVRSRKKIAIPVVLTSGEVAKILPNLKGYPELAVKIMYGSGLRVMETVRLRVLLRCK
ncbi:MAG: phage integrase N-terminal SAM-like domain-containing protein [candidate division Zixibacteria bacterium]|nr:phage integrase N-terminal SAM-like domain-containing protein [candidate division Zixibacteria bacterium]